MMPREAFESELRFLGLLIMENRLKERTTSVIKELNDCNVKTVMATGDNILTAVSVARQCHIANKSIEAWIGELMTDKSTKKVVWRSSIDTSLEK
jgi:cation-transporting ATPase 13A3/4/5